MISTLQQAAGSAGRVITTLLGCRRLELKAILGVDVNNSKSTLLILLTWPCAKLWSAQLCISMLRSKPVNEAAAKVLLRRREALALGTISSSIEVLLVSVTLINVLARLSIERYCTKRLYPFCTVLSFA